MEVEKSLHNSILFLLQYLSTQTWYSIFWSVLITGLSDRYLLLSFSKCGYWDTERLSELLQVFKDTVENSKFPDWQYLVWYTRQHCLSQATIDIQGEMLETGWWKLSFDSGLCAWWISQSGSLDLLLMRSNGIVHLRVNCSVDERRLNHFQKKTAFVKRSLKIKLVKTFLWSYEKGT